MEQVVGLSHLQRIANEARARGSSGEGSADAAELAYLAGLARGPEVRLIAEIGFNAGFSSYTFLEANPAVHVYSFDLGEHDYVTAAKNYIDAMFPGRHTLILGDSTQTVPAFQASNEVSSFDLVFIDGGHSYEVAKADLQNMRSLAGTDTVLVFDDLVPWKPWGEGPTLAWQEAIQAGFVDQVELVKDGTPVATIAPPGDRCWAVGRYRYP
ncbi:class I SAM-dependent methyltransferase [Nocardia otitidiscaviarum]|uniref:class I SAM-dependent methyltransferase n=1 Tax=Nocardia otitidiscaviarum TaxID=1823 RepID=UPI0020CBF6EE|nr:class I SAM-dependent methyltransferase [Nocardia otitidiscaviarum]MCP9625242.1 class I SAM-dependent methyltransferase [Nocardia otitidiscaviarum]